MDNFSCCSGQVGVPRVFYPKKLLPSSVFRYQMAKARQM